MYWPHPHRVASSSAKAVRHDGDEVVVQALPSLHGESFSDVDAYRVVRDLPDPSASRSRWSRPLRFVRDPLRRVRARRRLLREGFDVLHVETITYEVDAADLPRLARRMAVVLMVHDVLPHRSPWPEVISDRLHRRVYRSGAHLVVYHRVLADQLIEQFGVAADRVHVIPIPVSLVAESAESAGSTDLRMLLFFGSLRPNKGLQVLLDAIALGLPSGIRVVIAGTGDAELEASARSCAATHPHVEAEIGLISAARKRELFREASAVVLPYTSFAAQSGVLADAYAAQVPLIVSDVGAIGPTVSDEATGLVVPPNDAPALIAAIAEFVASPASRWEHALALAAQRHNPATVGAQLREVYRLALADRRARPT